MSTSVVVHYFAAARAATGVSEEHHVAGSVRELLAELGARHGERLASVLEVSSLLLDGQVSRSDTASLAGVKQVDVLPPFAGG
jgi:molybdopterin synthase sulfur carrier subunit